MNKTPCGRWYRLCLNKAVVTANIHCDLFLSFSSVAQPLLLILMDNIVCACTCVCPQDAVNHPAVSLTLHLHQPASGRTQLMWWCHGWNRMHTRTHTRALEQYVSAGCWSLMKSVCLHRNHQIRTNLLHHTVKLLIVSLLICSEFDLWNFPSPLSFLLSSLLPSPPHRLLISPSPEETVEEQQGLNLHLDISVCCSSRGGDGWRVAGTAALPWVTVVITGRDGCSLATSSLWLVGRKARKEREKGERCRKTEREVRKTQLEPSAEKAVLTPCGRNRIVTEAELWLDATNHPHVENKIKGEEDTRCEHGSDQVKSEDLYRLNWKCWLRSADLYWSSALRENPSWPGSKLKMAKKQNHVCCSLMVPTFWIIIIIIILIFHHSQAFKYLLLDFCLNETKAAHFKLLLWWLTLTDFISFSFMS